MLGFGQVMAPAFGSFATVAWGFRLTCDIVGLLCFFFAFMYFITCDGVEAFKTTCKNIREAKKTSSDPNELNASTMSLSSTRSSRLGNAFAPTLAGLRMRIVPTEVLLDTSDCASPTKRRRANSNQGAERPKLHDGDLQQVAESKIDDGFTRSMKF